MWVSVQVLSLSLGSFHTTCQMGSSRSEASLRDRNGVLKVPGFGSDSPEFLFVCPQENHFPSPSFSFSYKKGIVESLWKLNRISCVTWYGTCHEIGAEYLVHGSGCDLYELGHFGLGHFREALGEELRWLRSWNLSGICRWNWLYRTERELMLIAHCLYAKCHAGQ